MPVKLTTPEQKVRAAIRRSGQDNPTFVSIVSGWIEPALTSRLGEWYVVDLKRARFTFTSLNKMSFSARAIVHFGEEFEETAEVPFKWKYQKGKYKATFDFKGAKPLVPGREVVENPRGGPPWQPGDPFYEVWTILRSDDLEARRPLLAALWPEYVEAEKPDWRNDYFVQVWGEYHEPWRFGKARLSLVDLSLRLKEAIKAGRLF